jgi:hypothetical protein
VQSVLFLNSARINTIGRDKKEGTTVTHHHSEARRHLSDLVSAAGGVEWTLPTAAARAGEVLDQVSKQSALLAALARAAIAGWEDDGTGESYPQMDKLVLWRSDDDAIRLRLHVFLPGYVDRPHNHRWSFGCRLLSGSYLHTIYGTESEVLGAVARGQEPDPRYVRREQQGSGYFLHDAVVHSLSVAEVTVSLILRGPSVKERYFTVLPARDGESVADRMVWSGGAAGESRAERRAKEMDTDGVVRVVNVLERVLDARIQRA